MTPSTSVDTDAQSSPFLAVIPVLARLSHARQISEHHPNRKVVDEYEQDAEKFL
jgi:hypothetical protein